MNPNGAGGVIDAMFDPADNFHPSAGSAERMGQALADVYTAEGLTRAILPSSHMDARSQSASSKNIFDNPVVYSATGGAAQNGNTGTCGAHIIVQSSGTYTGVASVVPAWTGYGNAQRVVVSVAQSGANLVYNLYPTAAGLKTGKTYTPVLRIRTVGRGGSNPQSLLSNITLDGYLTSDGVAQRTSALFPVTGGVLFDTGDIDYTLICDGSPLVMGAAATSIRIILTLTFGATLVSPLTFDVTQIGYIEN